MFLEILTAKYISGFKIELEFNNGEIYLVDFENELTGKIFLPLRNDINLFKRFSIHFNTIEWENGADFAPEYLYEIAKSQHQMASEPESKYLNTDSNN